jgi:hypothetical protein
MNCNDLRNILNGDAGCFSIASSAAENGKKFRFNNPSHKTICRVHVDNCLIKDQTIRKCDFLFNIVEDSKYYLVELKGTSIDIALKQIVSTFEIVNAKIKGDPTDYTGIVVSSAVPKAANQKFKNLQDRIYRDKKLLIKRKQINTKNNYEDLPRV